MIELTDEQRGELKKPHPIEVRDPRTNEAHVLLHKEVYERVQRFIQEVNERADWDDPFLFSFVRALQWVSPNLLLRAAC